MHGAGSTWTRSASALVASVASLLIGVSSAAAHGLAPRALTPLLNDSSGVALVQLTRGLALRRADGFHYYCPAHWDNNENDPALTLPNGPALLGLASGLFLVAADGSVTSYPEPDLGITVALASASTAAYALSLRAGTYEVRRIERDHSQLLWSAPQSAGDWLSFGASDESLLLLGLDRGQLSQLQLSNNGSELARATAMLPLDTLSVQPQVVGSTPYVLTQSESGDHFELGRIASGKWLSLASASGNLAGPIETSAGKLLVAIDGALSSFDDEHVTPLGGSDFVTGLARFGSAGYASVRAGLAVLAADRPGALVFDFTALAEPLYDGLSPAERTDCVSSWQHLQVDLVAAGLTGVGVADAGAPSNGPADAAIAGVDATTPPPHASGLGSDQDAGRPRTASEQTAGGDASSSASEPHHGGGCNVVATRSPSTGGALPFALLALAAVLRTTLGSRARGRARHARHQAAAKPSRTLV